MEKNKRKEITKVVIASCLSIGLFSASFIGANTLAFAAAAGQTETLPPVTAAVIPLGETIPPAGYQQPVFIFYETPNDNQKSVNALSAEEAAELGAQYIWEIFGESIDGKIVEMYYNSSTLRTRPYWEGAVADTKSELDDFNASFNFCLDAITGARISISQSKDRLPDTGRGLQTMTPEEFRALGGETPEQLEEYAKLASEYAQKHFHTTKVESVIFDRSDAIRAADIKTWREGNGYILETPMISHESTENGENGIPFTEKSLYFRVTDNTGREATVVITAETKQLFSIDTGNNDFVPGVSGGN